MEDTTEKQRLGKIDGCVQKLVHIMNQYNDFVGGSAPLAKKPDAIKILDSWAGRGKEQEVGSQKSEVSKKKKDLLGARE